MVELLGKIGITPRATGLAEYEVLDLIAVAGRSYLSLKDKNTSPVTDKETWVQITENPYDLAARLGFKGPESEWLASLSAASESAAKIAVEATNEAKDATKIAVEATNEAKDATKIAVEATNEAKDATKIAVEASEKAIQSASGADSSSDDARTTIARLESLEVSLIAAAKKMPTSLGLKYTPVVTYRNTVPQNIEARLQPGDYSNNVLYLGDDRAISVAPDGSFTINEVGVSRIHVIPTENTSLYKTINIQVVHPVFRKVKGGSLRLCGNGTVRFT